MIENEAKSTRCVGSIAYTKTREEGIPAHTGPADPGQKLACAILYLACVLQFHHFWLKMGLQFSFLYELK